MYIMCMNVPLAVGYDLYKMRESVLDDEWFAWALETEGLEDRLTFVARILDLPPGNCTGRTPSPCVTIELEDGWVVLAHLPAIPAEPTTNVVVVDLMVGAKTGMPAYFEVWDYVPGDPEMTWNSVRSR